MKPLTTPIAVTPPATQYDFLQMIFDFNTDSISVMVTLLDAANKRVLTKTITKPFADWGITVPNLSVLDAKIVTVLKADGVIN